MQRRTATLSALAAAVAIGAVGGAGIYAAVDGGNTTIVRQVPVQGAQSASSTDTLSVTDIYKRNYKGVVEITVTSTQSSPYGGSQKQQAQGSGFVYDSKGDIVTNQHVVDGASAISVRFWNGATYKVKVIGTGV